MKPLPLPHERPASIIVKGPRTRAFPRLRKRPEIAQWCPNQDTDLVWLRKIAAGDPDATYEALLMWMTDSAALGGRSNYKKALLAWGILDEKAALWEPLSTLLATPKERVAWANFHQWLVACWPQRKNMDWPTVPYLPCAHWRALLCVEKGLREWLPYPLAGSTLAKYAPDLTRILLSTSSLMTRTTLYETLWVEFGGTTRWRASFSGPLYPYLTALQEKGFLGDIFNGMTKKEATEEFLSTGGLGIPEENVVFGHPSLTGPDLSGFTPIEASPLVPLVSEWLKSLPFHRKPDSLQAMVGPILNLLAGAVTMPRAVHDVGPQPVTHQNIVTAIAALTRSPKEDKKIFGVLGILHTKGDRFNVIGEFLAWATRHGYIEYNPLGENPWGAHCRQYPYENLEELDAWYATVREDGHPLYWDYTREEFAIILKAVPDMDAEKMVEALKKIPTKPLGGLLSDIMDRNAELSRKALLRLAQDKIAVIPPVPQPPQIPADVIEEDTIDELLTKAGITATDLPWGTVDDDEFEALFDEVFPKPETHEGSYASDIEPVKTKVNTCTYTCVPEILTEIKTVGCTAVAGPETVTGEPEPEPEPEEEHKKSWAETQEDFAVILNKAIGAAIKEEKMTYLDLTKPLVCGETGIKGFLKYCCKVTLESDLFDNAKFLSLLDSAMDESSCFSLMDKYTFSRMMRVSSDLVPYKNALDEFLHMCHRGTD